jgi:transcription elongation factor GreA-like protein
MSESLIKSVQNMLNEEKWTRATISNYSVTNFKDLDDAIKEASKAKCLDEIKSLCDEHLAHTKNSIIALYLSGIIALSKQLLDDSAMVNLVSIFIDNHKTQIVEHLCESRLPEPGRTNQEQMIKTLAAVARGGYEYGKI